MARGDHIRVRRFGYFHHGIDIGDGTVVHFSGEPGNKIGASICRTPEALFLKGGTLEIVDYGQCDHAETVIERALHELGSSDYHLVFNNCEHFARFCKTGERKSEQVKVTVVRTTAALAGRASTGLAISGVAAAGEVAGLSGAGIMSGLAAIGPGGALGGICTLAVAPAVIANVAVSKSLNDDPALPCGERDARSVARYAAKAGTVAGLGATVATISAAGTTAGLSAAGITSGLSAIGAGSMVTGAALCIAAPAAAATLAGFGAYKLYRFFTS